MTDQDDQNSIDAQLASLKARTENVRPRANFTANVMQAIASETGSKPNLWGDLPRVARTLVPVFALAAAVSVAFGIHGSNVFDDAMAQYEEAEIDW